MCHLLLVVLLSSVFSTSSANNFTYTDLNRDQKSMLDVLPSTLDCQRDNGAELDLSNRNMLNDALKNTHSDLTKTQECHCSINMLTLFPATASAFLQKRQARFIALIRKKPIVKTHAFTELVYRPPIK